MAMTGGFIDLCEQEQLHLSGAIQAYGALLVADGDRLITHASANIEQWLAQAPQQLIGTVLPDELTMLAMELGQAPGSRYARNNVTLSRRPASAVATRSGNGSITMELLPNESNPPAHGPIPLLGFVPFADLNDLANAQQQLVEHIQAHTGFDRVMLYLFRNDDTGEVIAEARSPQCKGTYLGLRFPASDIPRVARELYLKSPWRSIPDAGAAAVDLLGHGSVPDLSYVDLRSVSPVHRGYMQNMGVAGAISFPIKTASGLRALLSCHSSTARSLSLPELQLLAEQVQSYNLRVRELLTGLLLGLQEYLDRQNRQWLDSIANVGTVAQAWPAFSQYLMDEFGAQGVLLESGHERLTAGVIPDAESMEIIDPWLAGTQDANGISISQSLIVDCPDPLLTEVAGIASVSVRQRGRTESRCLLFRTEEIHEVSWGGNPNKPAEQHAGGLLVTPRNSFERWVETRLGYCREWPDETRIKLLNLRKLLLDLLS